MALITQTSRFKAAIITAVALHPDLVAAYLGDELSGISLGYYEHGQGNMGGTVWEYPERYLKNSPLFSFDRIETPLLMAHGTDDAVYVKHALTAANATFNALRRLGKPVEYRIYKGEGHAFMRKANVIDFWERRLEFLAEHLDLTLDDQGAIVFQGGRALSRKETQAPPATTAGGR